MTNQLTGAEIVFKALEEHGVEYIFGYPGGAVLPMYDQISKQKKIKHILVRSLVLKWKMAILYLQIKLYPVLVFIIHLKD